MTSINDLLLYYSGGSFNLDVVNSGYLSLGGYRSSIILPNNSEDALFEEITVTDAVIGRIDIRCIYVRNNNATDSMNTLKLYISGKGNYEKIYFGISIPADTSVGYVQKLSSRFEEPYGVTFVEAYDIGSAGTIATLLNAQTMIALWLKREILPISQDLVNLSQKSSWTLQFSWI